MTHLDLFAGLAGFSHAAEPYGATTLFCEIDPACQQVIRYHFNGAKIISDIRDLRGDQIEPVDVVTFGSPCQDMSVAGNRKGISGERSGLFFEAIRIIREMREATNGDYPRYAVFENVPGAFTSHRGQDFRAVLEAFAESEIPMPGTRRWAPAGVVRGAGRSIAWRTIDAQYWGVPQRRDRIYLVTDFRGQSAPEILFESPCLSGHSQEGREAGEETAAVVGDGAAPVFSIQHSTIGRKDSAGAQGKGWRDDGKAFTIDSRADADAVACPVAGFNGWRSTTGTLEYAEERAPAICETMPPNVVGTILGSGAGTARSGGGESETDLYITQPTIAFIGKNSAKTRSIGESIEVSPTIDSGGSIEIAQCITTGTDRRYDPETETLIPQIVGTITAEGADKKGSHGHKGLCTNQSVDAGLIIPVSFGPGDAPEVSHAIRAGASRADKPDSTTYITQGYCVRRLTPLECLRCFGYPDTWLDIAGLSDTAKYRMCGNSIAIPCARFVMHRIARRLEADHA